jgi:hypothetical protein
MRFYDHPWRLVRSTAFHPERQTRLRWRADRVAFRFPVKAVDARPGCSWPIRIEAPWWGLQQARRRNTMSKQPSHIAYVVAEIREGGKKQSIWRRVGSVWPHNNGGGFDLTIDDQIAVLGRIVCTVPKEKEPRQDAQPEVLA